MHLEGSCHCGKVAFSVDSPHPCPFNRCYCSACRKVAGSGGYAINLSGHYPSLKVKGQEHVRVYQVETEGQRSPLQRHFCGHCASMLWVYDPRWPELVHPFASAIDTELPIPPEHTHLMLGSKANWVEVEGHPDDPRFDEYPKESIAAWHDRLGLTHPIDR
ncbi:GFA family protein [Ferrimonas balearica]|uniref:GFA family protein n=1 Tax=Ferrimonas balearica TaxID=44012 RepID=UPI001C99E8AE|nr:GFA family protein [Ferrimonas balearica]MBY5992848.1 GFA family protein [Ferrimonas balearica]